MALVRTAHPTMGDGTRRVRHAHQLYRETPWCAQRTLRAIKVLLHEQLLHHRKILLALALFEQQAVEL